jgi:hypothetical protein
MIKGNKIIRIKKVVNVHLDESKQYYEVRLVKAKDFWNMEFVLIGENDIEHNYKWYEIQRFWKSATYHLQFKENRIFVLNFCKSIIQGFINSILH